jgi:serine/threonine protein kinase
VAAETVESSAFQVSSLKSLPFGVSDEVVTSLVFERILGKGTYKTVYLVSGHDATGNDVKYAMAVERLRVKSDVKDAFRGIRVAEKLQTLLEHNKDKDLFERIEGWWVQSNSLPDFSVGASIYPLPERLEGRTRKEPGKFMGTKWLVSLKPVYDMDLKSFAQKAPCLYPIGDWIASTKENSEAIGGMPLTDNNAMDLMLEVCRAGKLMHENGLVHHDVKPKNIMISQGHPVIIDFGFAQFVDLNKKDKRICAFHPGQIRGEVRYVLAEDVLKYRGCQDGDTYAMGKTMYEVIFGTAQGYESSGKQPISESTAKEQNDIFRAILSGNGAGRSSRFRLSSDTRDNLLAVIVGLCRQSNPLSFAEAESFILQNIGE